MFNRKNILTFALFALIGSALSAALSALLSQPVKTTSLLVGALLGCAFALAKSVYSNRHLPETSKPLPSSVEPSPSGKAPAQQTFSDGDQGPSGKISSQSPKLPSPQEVLSAAAAAAEKQKRDTKTTQDRKFYQALPGFRRLILEELRKQSDRLLAGIAVTVPIPSDISDPQDLLDNEIRNWLYNNNWDCKIEWVAGWMGEKICRSVTPKYHPGYYQLQITPLVEQSS